MKIIKLSFFLTVLVIIFSCSESKEKVSYNDIDKKIYCYEQSTALMKFINRGNERGEIYSVLNEMVLNIDFMINKTLSSKNSEEEKKEIVKTLNSFLNNTCTMCVDSIGWYNLNKIDSNYAYTSKINYIEFIIKNCGYSDSIIEAFNNCLLNNSKAVRLNNY